ncbi:hypothetical protein MPRF_24430 [Mycolicibacterium parafortuitum]|uniref:Secreted protein n=1 Tax=Mycolicibacterium parafortuitum TaxID=39692 RepID=A0A7I7U2I1_MYCPF|nr:hypothetical protein [Mycolicibacterium parafortuitum]BBY75544.1 hypothetical protein MPRF_24430 [Mycolicibacterium parafortuitum]
MPKPRYAIPFLATGCVASAILSAPAATATPMAPIPTEYPWCELDVWCYDDDLDIVFTPRRERYDVEYGGGSAFGN